MTLTYKMYLVLHESISFLSPEMFNSSKFGDLWNTNYSPLLTV